ncbi:conserved hypothetical protein [Leishmania infantum JPCM5]|uniref:Uncharacterized protein n=2 Tax=Leishmania infantum TaxID=5671 RepID=A4I870_LEIIN|nr:conserved hypothetical protein [Leishmania infantum JPCM5]CAC9526445.1 hypothetical_protein_-_conserved [Leishmania infantum]CAM71011.1 conserved hypothetical protein [Leishmania infantum JPCM5]SUZ44832.1 hypothetical_protein_-_conserved [Leishmania infantum]|eukprot:XP_001467939.1 conserved hypothetical protein [Leishmania infantum JPCM5]
MEEKKDKYEQLLAKVDWHAPHPPKGYQYGAGRGAKGFITTAELTTGVNTTAKMTRDENDFFAAMERLEERTRKPKREDDGAAANQVAGRHSSGASSNHADRSAPAKVKLSLEDLATLEAVPLPTAAKPITAAGSPSACSVPAPSGPLTTANSSLPAPASGPSAPLVVRSARTEEGEAAEEHVFAEERVLTAYDVLKGKASAVQTGLHNVLAMGSTEEQTTWITHARAYREMGMTRRAYQTLVDGCAVTGRKGKRIWEERLRYLAKDNYAGRRRLLEEATSACPTEEELWTQLLDCIPSLERVPCLQRAVLACPSSEHLWLRLVQYVPSLQDQRALLQKALQHTPTLPLLWARLARLETYQTGKEMFQAAAARYPSLALVIEAAKYVEWHELAHYWACRFAPTITASQLAENRESQVLEAEKDGAGSAASMAAMYAAVQRADTEVRDLVRTAQRNYLDLSEAGSRHAWLSLALSLLHKDDAKGHRGIEASNRNGEATETSRAATAAPSVYVCTAAHMFLCIVDPNDKKGAAHTIPATWLEDLVALLPADAASRHSVQCVLWYSWLQLQRQQLESMNTSNESSEALTVVGSSATAAIARSTATVTPRDILPVLSSAVLSASTAVLHDDLPVLWCCGRESSARTEDGAAVPSTARQPAVAHAALGARSEEQRVAEEDEEEELGKPCVAPAAASTTPAPVKAKAADLESELPLPPPLIVALASLLGSATHVAAAAAGLLAGASLGSQGLSAQLNAAPSVPANARARSQLSLALELLLVEVPLAVSDALYRRGCFAAALSFIDRLLHTINSSATEQTAGALRLYVARSKMLAAVGDTTAADACLVSAIAAAKGAAATVQQQQREEEVWVKLAVLRRSQGQPIDALLVDALQRFPRSSRLWLMRLEEKRRAIQQRQDVLAPTSTGVPVIDLLRQDESLASDVRDLRVLCKKALAPDHCRAVAAVWVFVAARVEAELLQNVAAARALLTDALAACAADLQSTRSHVLAQGVSAQELERQASAVARIGATQAMLDVQYGTPGQALEMVQEVLQKLPKTREGTFAMAQDDAVGELLGLFISLEPPASRGRAAAQVMRQWKSREPLALCAVAQLYYAAGQYARALDQAKKAVQLSKGRCGDAVGLLWRMAESPAMQPLVREVVAGKTGEDSERSGEGEKRVDALSDAAPVAQLTAEAIQQWVFSFMNTSADAGVGSSSISGARCALATEDDAPAVSTGIPATPLIVVPNSGPLWITVAKAEDPSNVTLLGYRRPVAEMLRDVANRIILKGPESASAATHA